jgi:hypothetical protein
VRARAHPGAQDHAASILQAHRRPVLHAIPLNPLPVSVNIVDLYVFLIIFTLGVSTRPGDRYIGETAQLQELPEASLSEILKKNRDVPPLTGADLIAALKALVSPDGLEGPLFWRAFDQCNCGAWITKEYLHTVHGPSCLTWEYFDPEPTAGPSNMASVPPGGTEAPFSTSAQPIEDTEDNPFVVFVKGFRP